jgi:clan AA aspartic protease
MIRGRVEVIGGDAGLTYLAPRIAVKVAGVNRIFRTEEAIVDTGFTGWLTLPQKIIRDLGLTYYGERPAILADSEEKMFDLYGALVSWHGHQRAALVLGTDGTPLVGMALLRGGRLTIDAWDGGDVVIEEIR